MKVSQLVKLFAFLISKVLTFSTDCKKFRLFLGFSEKNHRPLCFFKSREKSFRPPTTPGNLDFVEITMLLSTEILALSTKATSMQYQVTANLIDLCGK